MTVRQAGMKPSVSSIDPSIAVSIIVVCILVMALGSSRELTRAVVAFFEAVWLYLSNTRG